MGIIKACIFDLGGTIVDKYSLTPIIAFRNAFLKHKIILPKHSIINYMGMNKKEHIQKIIENDNVKDQWLERNNIEFGDEDIDNIYNDFKEIQKGYTIENMKIIPQTWKCINELQNRGIQIGVTTGFDKEQMNLVRLLLERNNIMLDNYVSSTCLESLGRPHPSMIIENMYKFDIDDPREVIKIDDTTVGIKEGLNAGCWTVGVSRWSVNMDVDTIEEANKMNSVIANATGDNYSDNYYKLVKKRIMSKSKLEKSGAHYVIETLLGLPNIIDEINDTSKPLRKVIRSL